MKLIRFGAAGKEQPGIVNDDGIWLDCSAFGTDWNESFFANGGPEALAGWLESNRPSCPVVPAHTRLGPPVARPSKLVCVGLNYVTHAREAGMEIPDEPVLFMKSTTSICGPFDDIVIPRIRSATGEEVAAQQTDWEVELAIVIGRECVRLSEQEAMDHVAGYVLHNDVSERETQLHRSGQWVKGKSFDSFAPLGPWLVTPDEIPDPGQLALWLKLNGEVMQNDNTREMIFPLPELIRYVSWHMRLLPGDIITTGTPFGVGMGLRPERYLRAGDEIELGIEGLGIARQRVTCDIDAMA
ncbi:fumarylacetoacetate hydrolase family protein [Elongatibacter sediminis]|uniref:Fumarylacetoacetate hydrolase family protein n=1 Tax=Elongatibacter sediminis TaxID=3119006 RepID=A0AAW9RIX6_9GAMM